MKMAAAIGRVRCRVLNGAKPAGGPSNVLARVLSLPVCRMCTEASQPGVESPTVERNVTTAGHTTGQSTPENSSKPFTVRSLCRTTETDPRKHSEKHLGLFYTIPNEDIGHLFSKGLGVHYKKQINTFQEACVMVRKPALEIMSYIEVANYSNPPLKYVLYGKNGCGKTMTMAHVMHGLLMQDWLFVYVPWPKSWSLFFKEISPSLFRQGFYDLPLEAVAWLQLFRHMNKKKIEELDLRTTQTYTWTKREIAEEGTPLLEIIEYGINRARFASDVMGALLKEIRIQSSTKGFKTLVAVDGVNGLWANTQMKTETRQLISPEDVTLFHHLKKMFQPIWNNGAILLTVDENASDPDRRASHLPQHLLGMNGFEAVDPFIPVAVEPYTDKEATSCIEYYLDRMWICHTKAQTTAGKRELMFLSGKNPYELMKIAGSW